MSFANLIAPTESLRARLTFWYLSALAVALSTFALLLYGWLGQTLYRHHDADLEANAARITRALVGVATVEPAVAQALRTIDAVPRMTMVRGREGELIYRSPLLQVAEPTIGRHEALVHAAAHAPAAPEFFNVSLEQSGLVRFICTPIPGDPAAYLQIGNPLGDVPATLHAVAVASLVLIPLVVLFTSMGGWLIAGRALAPIAFISGTLRDIQATDLSKRVELNPADRELHDLVNTINGLLARLNRVFDDLRQFAADASHQLQTPLAVMKGTIEMIGRAPTERQATLLDDLDQEVNDMSAVIADLQALSLADADIQRAQRQEVDFSALCLEVIDIVSALGEARHVVVHGDIPPGVRLVGDEVKLKQVLLNLGDNAIKYTPPGGVVRYRLRRDAAFAVVDVSDTGHGISAADLPRVFERFYRATGGAARGAGLGLAIVKRFVEVHQGEISVSSEPARGTTFSIRLPA